MEAGGFARHVTVTLTFLLRGTWKTHAPLLYETAAPALFLTELSSYLYGR